MKPRAGMVGADNQAPARRADNERSRADSLSQTRSILRPWNFSWPRDCWIIFAKNFKCPVVLYWNKDPEKKLAVFWAFNGYFWTWSSEERTESKYDTLYWPWHWRTPYFDRFTGRIAWVRDSTGRTFSRIFSSFLHCWASNFFRDLIIELVGVRQRKQNTILCLQWSGVGYLGRTEGHQGSPTFRKMSLFSLSYP